MFPSPLRAGRTVLVTALASALLVTAVPTHAPSASAAPAVPAFPGAEGWGTQTPGGRGGRVIAVTNLNDSGPGSLRAAVQASGRRIVVFRVSGTITLSSRIDIDHPFLTIAGQTAPGGGVTLRGTSSHVKDLMRVRADDVVIRYLRFRHGTPSVASESADNLLIGSSSAPVRRVVVDHCSFSWAVDGNLETYYDTREVTFSWNLITESLSSSMHPEGEHSKNMHLSGEGAGRFSVHHNLMANGMDRNPQPTGLDDYDVRNNVVYNWGKKATYVSSSKGIPTGNIVGNFYRPGPNSTWKYEVAHYDGDNGSVHRTYVHGNIGPNRPTDSLSQSAIVRPDDRGDLVTTPFTTPRVTTTSAQQAYTDVLAHAGASFPHRDAVDARAVAQVRNNTGRIINHEKEVGGYPALPAGAAPVDSDGDGMPDDWEAARGLDPRADDSARDRDGDGWTNVEEYVNGLVTGTGTVAPPPPAPTDPGGGTPAAPLPRSWLARPVPDVLAADSRGDLYLYPGSGDGGFSPRRVVGNGWNAVDLLTLTGDWDGDGRHDILARSTTDGSLLLYGGDGAGGFSTRRVIGKGWGGIDALTSPTDWNGDSAVDLLARRRTDGALVLYPGDGAGGFRTPTQVGRGWQSMSLVTVAGDWDGDRRPDIVARDSLGRLRLYSGDGRGGFVGSRVIGTGWGSFTSLTSLGDFDGDGRTDLVGVLRDGTMRLYSGNGTGGFRGSRQIGQGWGSFRLTL